MTCAADAGSRRDSSRICSQKAEIEQDISEGRIRAAEYEMIRMRVRDRVKFRCGDSLSLTPSKEPQAILLDAPCTGSGTWGRHPESKWRMTPEMVMKAAELQRDLLERAVSLVAPGGVVAYSTCSMFREENEKVVAAVMARHPELTEAPVERSHKLMLKGKPYGTVIWPGLPWVDSFYLAACQAQIEEGLLIVKCIAGAWQSPLSL